jgi:glycosyltransferase involved in cell wall biosynthesis
MDLEMINNYNLLNFKYFINLPQPDLVRIMHESDVFVFPSLCEGFGLVILEAMATGLPVITTDRTSGVDFIENGVEGYIIDAQNVEMIKMAIMKFVNSPEIIKEMGEKSINKSQQFTWDLFGERLINSIEKFENYDL